MTDETTAPALSRTRAPWEAAVAAKLNDSRNARKLVEALAKEPDALENLNRKLNEKGLRKDAR